jgi:predicted nucleotidyltransferase
MRTSIPALLPLFRSELQLRLLALLVLNPNREWTARELQERTMAPPASVHRELHRALDAGLVVREAVGHTHRYSAARSSPLFEPLSLLLARTVGLEHRLRAALSQIDGVEAAVLHGSWATGRVGPTSDLDLLVVGEVEPVTILRAVRPIERETARSIDFTVFRPHELRAKLAAGNGFLRSVFAGPHEFLVGHLDEPVHAA